MIDVVRFFFLNIYIVSRNVPEQNLHCVPLLLCQDSLCSQQIMYEVLETTELTLVVRAVD